MTDFATACILSYNRPEFLKTAVQTCLERAGAPLELIIHDDGSEDPDVYRVLNWAHSLGATLILNRPGNNQGQGTALNRMFHMAAGDPIIKLDQDLIFYDGWLVDVKGILARNKRHLPGSGRGMSVGREAVELSPREPEIGLLALMHYDHDPVASRKCKMAGRDGWEEHTHILGSAFAVTRKCWKALGPFEEHSDAFAEDWAFQRRVTDSDDFACGLPIYGTDLVQNQGFGVGPSTVVVAEGTVAEIHHEPFVIGRA